MDFLEPLSELKCLCGKIFHQQSALSNHRRNCQRSSKRLTNALAVAKDAWEARKRKKREKTEDGDNPVTFSDAPMVVDNDVPSPEVCHNNLLVSTGNLIGPRDSLAPP